jgi:hypothetical protein
MSIPSKQLKLASVKEVKMAFLNNSTHILFAPPSGVIRPKDPLEGVDEIEVLFDGEKETRNIRIGKAIYFDIRILNK